MNPEFLVELKNDSCVGPLGPPENLARKEMKPAIEFNSWNTVNTQHDATRDMCKTEGASPYRTMSYTQG